jgi:hypothetical protein
MILGCTDARRIGRVPTGERHRDNYAQHRCSKLPGTSSRVIAASGMPMATAPRSSPIGASATCCAESELTRYKIVLKQKAGTGTGTIYAHLRLLAPSWETSGAQGN